MIAGVSKVVVPVGDQDQAREFWTTSLGFELVQDVPYGGGRWVEVRSPDKNVVLVLEQRRDSEEGSEIPAEIPTSPVMFYCDDLEMTYQELTARGVEFAQAPTEMPFGWWSMFKDPDGNRYALEPHGQ
jgi:predicted enzyme related to lactoylglutathione lyase